MLFWTAVTWDNGDDPPVELSQIEFFVNRKGEIVLIGSDGYTVTVLGMISDALREE